MKVTSAGGARRHRAFSAAERLVVRCFLLLLSISAPSFAFEAPKPKNVLIFYSFTKRDTFYALEPLKSTLRSRFRAPVHFEIEYLESQHFGIAGYRESVSEVLRHAYGKEKFDLVVTDAFPALRFALDYRERMFPGVPVVFIEVDSGRLKDQILPSGVTGITLKIDLRGTLDLALRLHPDTKTVAVVTGTSEFERYWQNAVHRVLLSYASRVHPVDLAGLPTDELLRQVAALPSHSVVLFQLIPAEASQPVVGTMEILTAISQHFPTYCIFDYCLDHGAIGGSYNSSPRNQQGIRGGELAARVLAGEKPENIHVVQPSGVHSAWLDWRQLRKWNIPESALPPGSIVLHRQPTLWERHKMLILVGILLTVFQALLIIGLLWQRLRAHKTEATLSESEKRFTIMADTAPLLIWMCDRVGKVTYLSEKWLSFTGGTMQSEVGRGWTAHIHPDDLINALDLNISGLEKREGFSREYRLRHREGEYRWIFDVASARVDADGSFAGFIGSAIDVTDQKLAQEALEKLGGHLIEAQERERSRIARELHDDICQRLALLSMEVYQANECLNGSAALVGPQLTDIRTHCAEIATDVQALSHELHSSKLDYLGIVAAIRGFCKEFSKQQSVDVTFAHENVPSGLPREISLCLFRVAQEALHNALKHSGVSRFTVHLWYQASELWLEVRDQGKGFDVKLITDAGLGLVSMKERAHLVNGNVSIESKPNGGTMIRVRVPLRAEARVAGARECLRITDPAEAQYGTSAHLNR